MTKISIVSDTSQDMTYEIGKKFGIEVISYYIQMGERYLKDQVDINSKEFYETMGNYDVLTSGVPPINDALELFERLSDDGVTDAILITSSEKLTGMRTMYEAAKLEYKKIRLHIFRTNQIASSAALIAIYASKLRDKGLEVDEILEKLNGVLDKVHIFALFRTLKYLVKGGRFNKYKGLIGTFLHINPLLYAKDGEIAILDKFRGKKKSLGGLVDVINQTIGDSQKYWLCIFSGNNPDEVEELREKLKDKISNADLYLETEFTPLLGVHAGPNSIGVSVLKLD